MLVPLAMDKAGATRLVHYTTDMIYGHTYTFPQTEEHPASPLGEYGLSKLKTEELRNLVQMAEATRAHCGGVVCG